MSKRQQRYFQMKQQQQKRLKDNDEKEKDDNMKKMAEEVEALQKIVAEQNEKLEKKEKELEEMKNQKQNIPDTVQTKDDSKSTSKVSDINTNEDTNLSIYLFMDHKDHLLSAIKKYVERQIFPSAKFPLSDEHSKALLVNGVKNQTIVIPVGTTAEEFATFFNMEIPKFINNNRHKSQILMRRHYIGM